MKTELTTSHPYELETIGEPRDLLWNHLDLHHRPQIHNSYTSSLSLELQESHTILINYMPILGSFKHRVMVYNKIISRTLAQQNFILFGFFSISVDINFAKNRIFGVWKISSPKIFGFLHPWLGRKFVRLSHKLNAQDAEIRKERTYLRQLGFTSPNYDAPNYLNSNLLDFHLRAPRGRSCELNLSQAGPWMSAEEWVKIKVEADESGGLLISPLRCPHEGAPLIFKEKNCDTIKCPWHGLTIKKSRLVKVGDSVELLGMKIFWKNQQVLEITT